MRLTAASGLLIVASGHDGCGQSTSTVTNACKQHVHINYATVIRFKVLPTLMAHDCTYYITAQPPAAGNAMSKWPRTQPAFCACATDKEVKKA